MICLHIVRWFQELLLNIVNSIYNEIQIICTKLYDFKQLRLISRVHRVFTNVPGDRGSIPGRVIPKT